MMIFLLCMSSRQWGAWRIISLTEILTLNHFLGTPGLT
ncbi:hypothetical protein GYH30_044860 [Glycine max]|nr:hypothetical protein GYH30_044860 [Glycine max]